MPRRRRLLQPKRGAGRRRSLQPSIPQCSREIWLRNAMHPREDTGAEWRPPQDRTSSFELPGRSVFAVFYSDAYLLQFVAKAIGFAPILVGARRCALGEKGIYLIDRPRLRFRDQTRTLGFRLRKEPEHVGAGLQDCRRLSDFPAPG